MSCKNRQHWKRKWHQGTHSSVPSVLCRRFLSPLICSCQSSRYQKRRMIRISKLIFVAATCVSLTGLMLAQRDPATDAPERKVTTRVAPDYPELAKRMHLAGSVKIEAVVRPNGSVKSTRVIGGNPVLVQAASDAVSKWKFEAAPNETTEVLQLTFVAK